MNTQPNTLVVVDDGVARVLVGDALIVDMDMIRHGDYTGAEMIGILRNLYARFYSVELKDLIDGILREIEYLLPEREREVPE